MIKALFTYSLLLATAVAFSQEEEKGKEEKDRALPRGNSEYSNKDYAAAEAQYRISGSKSPTKAAASYNLGNAIYRQGQQSEAKYAYAKAIQNAKTKAEKHKAYHNLGNALMTEKNYQAAVEAYKNALRNNPQDDETRYNFALAKQMLKDNPPPPPPKDDKKDDKKDKDKQDNKSQQPNDPKDQGGKGDEKDKGDKGDQKDKGGQGDQKDKGNGQDKKDKGGNGNEQQQPAQANPDRQRMENLLDAMNNEEKKIQDKINAQKGRARPVKQEKDW